MHPKNIQIEAYRYDLPEQSIAKFPLKQRDESKLLVFKDGHIQDHVFNTIANQLPAQSLLVYNQTKVVYARLLFKKETGGKVEVFCLEPDARYADVPTAMVSKGEVYWKCLLGGASKWKEGQYLILEEDELKVQAERIALIDGAWVLRLFWNDEKLSFAEVLQKVGKVPLPPYLNREATVEDEASYQSMFAKEEGSVAAPTASLHFTPAVMEALHQQAVESVSLTLHVGAGTFKPVKSDTMEGHEMHAEWMEINVATILKLKEQLEKGNAIIPVGTTSCRTLESLYWIGLQMFNGVDIKQGAVAVSQWLPYEHSYEEISPAIALQAILDYLKKTDADKLITKTQIIIAPAYTFKIVDALITNFHQPESTLLLLVSALIGNDWTKIYQHALKNNYRFLSYGDSSLLWKS